MSTDRFRSACGPSRRVISVLFGTALLLSACGNAGATPNTQNGGGGNGNGIASPSESIPPDVPRNLK